MCKDFKDPDCMVICVLYDVLVYFSGKQILFSKGKNKMIVLKIANEGDIKIKLNKEAAPITAANFEKLVSEGFYDGLKFHRVIEGFMIQGGCPRGNGTGGPGYSIEGEFAANGHDNPLKHKRGVVSMARSMQPNSAGSQFFIMHKDAPHLDGQYAAFGKVVEGMDIVDIIASSKTDLSDRPIVDVIIEKAYIEPDEN